MIVELVETMGLLTDKTTCHSYGDFYDRELAPYLGHPIRLLEIGVDRGGSLRLWDAYFERSADVVGVDVDLSRLELGAEWVATVVRADAYDEATAAGLGEFDIIIDDGPHTLASMLAAIRLYPPKLRTGGLMVIEDVQDPSWLATLDAAVPEGYGREVVDLRPVKGRYDDLLFVIRAPGAHAR